MGRAELKVQCSFPEETEHATTTMAKHYTDRTDREKIAANWTKTRGLFSRGEASMAVVRAAISMELSANLSIRALYKGQKTPAEIKDLLIRCNGIARKFSDHIVKLSRGTAGEQTIAALYALSKLVNAERNLVCHSGVFKSKREARAVIDHAREVAVGLVRRHHADFDLKPLPPPKKKKQALKEV